MRITAAIVGLVAISTVAACSQSQEHVTRHERVVAMLAHDRELADLYSWVATHQDALQYMPCPCGCGDMGHTSNVSCFIGGGQNGKVLYDDHAIGCQDCQDVALETRKLLGQGKSLSEIRTVVDRKYPGRPTDTPKPPAG